MGKEKKTIGWQQMIADFAEFNGKGNFPLPAYSEFMPPPRLGKKPYGEINYSLFSDRDLYGWGITELEEAYELKPGLKHIGKHIMDHVTDLGRARSEFHIIGHGGSNIKDNPYWPEELAAKAGKLDHERYVLLLPLSLSRTQDDKGRVRWTLFGSSEQGPEKAFWKSFYTAPGVETKESEGTDFIKNILNKAYGEKLTATSSLLERGFRILPTSQNNTLPGWTNKLLIKEDASFAKVKYLLTFNPFTQLTAEVKELYLLGKLALLPFPGSLVFWGMPTYLKLQKQLPNAIQIPILRLLGRHTGLEGIKVPQSGWINIPHPDLDEKDFSKELILNKFKRTHRWQRIHRNEDELLMDEKVDEMAKIFFSTDLKSMGLYDKPLVKNCQIWTRDYNAIIHGPHARRTDIYKAETRLLEGGLYGYRFYYPPMVVGKHDVYLHRPLVAYLSAKTNEIEVQTDALYGYMTAYDHDNKNISDHIELWPRMHRRPAYLSAIEDFESKRDHYKHETAYNIITLMDTWKMLGEKPLERTFARNLLHTKKDRSLQEWLDQLPERSTTPEKGLLMKSELEKIIAPIEKKFPAALTYEKTKERSFEEKWWNDIHYLAHGKFMNTDNADFVKDEISMSLLEHHQRDLEELGDYLIERHKDEIAKAGMSGKALVGELPFKWHTDFDFSDFGGWKRNQDGQTYERNILVIIPGKNRKEAVVMGDHYDTAYMEDEYDKENGGSGARISAKGADDNFSATSTLLQAAPIFLQMSKEGKLERDIWLIHLTGEEFPSDCLGARNFCETLMEKTARLRFEDGKEKDISGTKIVGAFVMDMIGHNKETDQDVFQISPGKSMQSLKIAYQAHIANMIWNTHVPIWNKENDRKKCKAGKRTTNEKIIPEKALHLSLTGEVRTQYNPHSSIFNTDGQIFSDVGVPIVLFMENYDISRTGYHDKFDTIENIDLDYGAAFAAIAIETVARVATLGEI